MNQKTMKKAVILALVAGVMVGQAGIIQAEGTKADHCDRNYKSQNNGCCKKESCCRRGDRKELKKKLGLSRKQVKQIKRLDTQFESEKESLKDKISTLNKQLKERVDSQTPDYPEIRRLMNEIGALKVSIKIKKMKHKEAVKAVLTPEQRSKFTSHGHQHDQYDHHYH